MSFKDYEKPEGWSAGLPEVLVHQDTIDALGMPVVDYESMGDLVLQITQGKVPSIMFHTIPSERQALGSYTPYSTILNVDAKRAELARVNTGGVVGTIAHEAQHFSDFVNHPTRTRLEIAAQNVLYLGRTVSRRISPRLGPLPECDTYYSTERRAYSTTLLNMAKEHEQDVLFPHSIRTRNLLFRRQLALNTITKLGIEYYPELAADYVKPKSWFRRIFLR